LITLSKYLNVTGVEGAQKPLQEIVVQQEKEIGSLRERMDVVIKQLKGYEGTLDLVIKEFLTMLEVVGEKVAIRLYSKWSKRQKSDLKRNGSRNDGGVHERQSESEAVKLALTAEIAYFYLTLIIDLTMSLESRKSMKIRVDDIRLDPVTIRYYQSTDGQKLVDNMVRKLKERGQREPIIVNEDLTVIWRGHTRYFAAKRLGWAFIEAIIASSDEWSDYIKTPGARV
jgi:hypothetical protein